MNIIYITTSPNSNLSYIKKIKSKKRFLKKSVIFKLLNYKINMLKGNSKNNCEVEIWNKFIKTYNELNVVTFNNT